MKNLFLTLIGISILGCSQPKNSITNDYFENTNFIEVIGDDTIYLSFLDTTYALLSNDGIQQRSNWSIKSLGNQQLLILGFYNESIFQIKEYSDKSCTLKRVGYKEQSEFVIQKLEDKKIQFRGIWQSHKMPPPPISSLNDTDLFDSIFKDKNLWESEIFEITDDSIKYSLYDYQIATKYEEPFIQLETDIRAANGRLSLLRPIDQNDSTLTLEFYYTDGNRNLDRENKKLIRTLKTVANKK